MIKVIVLLLVVSLVFTQVVYTKTKERVNNSVKTKVIASVNLTKILTKPEEVVEQYLKDSMRLNIEGYFDVKINKTENYKNKITSEMCCEREGEEEDVSYPIVKKSLNIKSQILSDPELIKSQEMHKVKIKEFTEKYQKTNSYKIERLTEEIMNVTQFAKVEVKFNTIGFFYKENGRWVFKKHVEEETGKYELYFSPKVNEWLIYTDKGYSDEAMYYAIYCEDTEPVKNKVFGYKQLSKLCSY